MAAPLRRRSADECPNVERGCANGRIIIRSLLISSSSAEKERQGITISVRLPALNEERLSARKSWFDRTTERHRL